MVTTITPARTGDTYAADSAIAATSASGARAGMNIESAPNVGAGAQDLVVTLGAGVSGGVAYILEVAGLPTSGIRDATSPAINTGSDASAETNSLTNVTADAIFVNLCASESGSGTATVTKDANYTAVVGGTTMSETDGANYQVSGMSYRIVSATGAQTPTYTVTAANWGTMIAVYKMAAGGAATWGPLLGGENNRLVVAT